MIKNLKVILFIIALFGTSLVFGQTQKHKIPIGGAIGGSVQISDLGNSYGFAANVSTGYFLSNGILVKARLGYNYFNSTSQLIGVDYIWTKRVVALGARYYFKTGKLQPLIGAELGYAFDTYPNSAPTPNNIPSRGYYEPVLEIGASYFINENIAIEIVLPTNSLITFNIGTQIYLR
jgi:outer membrane protein W